jgi:hypothetical protein
MLYGAQIWGVRNDGEPAAPTLLQPLRTIQNRCLRNITGAYRRTPTAALERETDTPPIDLYIDKVATQHAISTRTHAVTQAISTAADGIWKSLTRQPAPSTHRPGRRPRGRPRRAKPRPPGPTEALRARAETREQQIRQHLARSECETRQRRRRTARDAHQAQRGPGTVLRIGLYQEWEQRWRHIASDKSATTWRAPWRPPATRTYDNLQKHEATALFLLRTEVIGLKSWLHSVGVPGILPRCACGWEAQTVRHIMIHCPQYIATRAALFRQAGSTNLQMILSTPRGGKAAARWLIASGILPHFTLAREIAQEDTSRYQPPQELDTWS